MLFISEGHWGEKKEIERKRRLYVYQGINMLWNKFLVLSVLSGVKRNMDNAISAPVLKIKY